MLTIFDPTNPRGRALCAALRDTFPSQQQTFFHTTGVEEHLLAEVAGEARLVRPLDDCDELLGSTALILTAPPAPAVGARLAAWLETQPNLPVIDWSLPPVLAATQSSVFGAAHRPTPGSRRLQVLDPALAGPAVALAALAPLRLQSAHLTLLTPAADAGEEAVEELAQQAAARLSGARPARTQRLPGVLAFDAGPVSKARRAHLEAQLGQLGVPSGASLTALATSSFYGHLALLTVTLAAAFRKTEVEKALRQAGLQLAGSRPLGMLSAVVGSESVHCGEVAGHEGVWSLVLQYDGGQLVGPAAVVELLAYLTGA